MPAPETEMIEPELVIRASTRAVSGRRRAPRARPHHRAEGRGRRRLLLRRRVSASPLDETDPMYLGTQNEARDDDDYRVMAQLGIRHVCSRSGGRPARMDDRRPEAPPGPAGRLRPFPRHGAAAVELPASGAAEPGHLLAGPDRDRQSIHLPADRAALQAGIPFRQVQPEHHRHSPHRTGARAGRFLNSTFRWDKADHTAAPSIAGVVSEEENWERIDYFLSRRARLRSSAKVRLACHPHDPYTPPGYRGVTRVLGTVEGLKKFVTMHESPYHGLNFCQGSIGEMLDNPREEIDDVIRWFGTRGRSSTFTSATSQAVSSPSWKCFPTRGTWTWFGASRSTVRWAING